MNDQFRPIIHLGITGAEGHIGSLLRDGLSDRYRIRSFTLSNQDFSSTSLDLAESGEVEGKFEGLDALIHLAADPSPFSQWPNVIRNNIDATYNVFEEARRSGVRRIVFASTNHVQHGDTMKGSPEMLDTSLRVMLRLNDPPNPTSLYGVSKLFGEDLGRYYSREYGVEFVALRIGATGPNDDSENWAGKPEEDYIRAMFLSKRDCIEAFTRALEVDTDFLIAYAVSNNSSRIFDLRETQEKLRFIPVDSSDEF